MRACVVSDSSLPSLGNLSVSLTRNEVEQRLPCLSVDIYHHSMIEVIPIDANMTK